MDRKAALPLPEGSEAGLCQAERRGLGQSPIMNEKNALSSLKETWHKIDNLYDLYAKSVGLNFASILILQLLHDSAKTYTQKDLCEKLGLPKQIVNSIMRSFWERGYVELKEAKDRRNKDIILTDAGVQYAVAVLQPLENAETTAWDSFSAEDVSYLAATMGKFVRAFKGALEG